ncbi:hypothetical protein PMAYCL1PPCAC_15983, partial [Pristionchus mayeri]
EFQPATFGSLEVSNRILLTAVLQFGASAFDEFSTFSLMDRWTLVKNFFSRYRVYEDNYRAEKAFKHDMHKTFGGYTMYFARDEIGHFFDDTPNSQNRLNCRVMGLSVQRQIHGARKHLRSLNMHHEEFLGVWAIMFWDTEGMEVSEEVMHASKVIKEAILKELESFYREKLNLEDFAPRLGELLTLLSEYEQRSDDVKQHFEILRLLNVFTDNTLMYR